MLSTGYIAYDKGALIQNSSIWVQLLNMSCPLSDEVGPVKIMVSLAKSAGRGDTPCLFECTRRWGKSVNTVFY